MILTKMELMELTGGKRKKEIIAWLKAEGFTFRVKLDGWPAVHEAHVADKLGAPKQAVRKPVEVRLDHLPGAKHGKKAQESTRPA